MQIVDSTALDYTRVYIFVVYQRLTDLGTEENIFSKYTGTTEFRTGIDSTDAFNFTSSNSGSGATKVVTSTLSSPVGTTRISECYYDGTNISVLTNASNQVSTTETTIAQGNSVIEIFSRSNTVPFAGYVGEILMYTKMLSTTETAYVRKYLGAKWGIPL